MKRLTASLTLFAVLAFAAMAAAQDKAPKPEGMMPGHGKGIVRVLESLNLSPGQKHQVAQILKDNREQSTALRESMKKALAGLREVMDQNPGDEAAVRNAAQAVAKVGEDLAVNRGKVKAKINAVLTPEQKAKQAEMRTKFKEKFKERMGNRHHELDTWIDQNLS